MGNISHTQAAHIGQMYMIIKQSYGENEMTELKCMEQEKSRKIGGSSSRPRWD